MLGDDPALHEQMLRDVLRMTAELDLSESPPAMGQRIHRRLRALAGDADPYAAVKAQFNRLALDMLPALEAQVEQADDPFARAVRLAIAGNVIDLGVVGTLSEEEIRCAVGRTLLEPFHGDIDGLRRAVNTAGSILYIADNAGEIVFDRLLLEHLPLARTKLAVRGAPVLNDATRADAATAGLDALVEVIDTGSDAPGVLLEDCGAAFREAFDAAELVIAKGQGNFETLSHVDKPIYFLFKAKCPVIAGHVGLPVGAHAAMLWREGALERVGSAL